MRSTILVRIVIGYLAIFIPVVAVSAYAFSQLSLFRKVISDILLIDNRMREIEQGLAESILAQTRYEKKYIITGDKEFHKQYMIAEKDINIRINEAISIADTPHKRKSLTRIKDHYKQYRSIFNEEVEFIKTPKSYLQDDFREKKEKAVDEILEELKNLKLFSEQDTYKKIKHLRESGEKANRLSMVAGACFIFSGVIIAIFITRSITRPLYFMRRKTRQVAKGDFDVSLNLSSPPEIGELAQDFNLMCNQLKQMDKMKSDFFSLMAHELRTPLASIKEGTNLLMEGIGDDDTEKGKEVLTIIAEESNRLTDLVNALLDLKKMEEGMITLNLEKSDIHALINKVVSGIAPLAITKSVNIKVDIQHGLPYVKVDEERILQVLRNLIGNAVKFTPGGGQVAISAQATESGVSVAVADTGPGIPKEDLNMIFDKFQQVTMTGFNEIKGTGLGLAIVKHTINAHGGKVWAESKTGQGSTFIFLLPA